MNVHRSITSGCLLLLLANALHASAVAPQAPNGHPLPPKPVPVLNAAFDARLAHRDPPPQQIPRAVAEFERMQGVLIRYPFGLPYPLIASIASGDTVFKYAFIPPPEPVTVSRRRRVW